MNVSREGEFMIYCVEIYKYAKQMSGREVISLFEQYEVMQYVKQFYEALHTTGEQYIVQDIDDYIRNRQTA